MYEWVGIHKRTYKTRAIPQSLNMHLLMYYHLYTEATLKTILF